jgi:hypothetical protein
MKKKKEKIWRSIFKEFIHDFLISSSLEINAPPHEIPVRGFKPY